jgi:phosphatidate cytidylyltransferase
MPPTDPEPPSIRAAHRARHLAAAPDPYPTLDDDEPDPDDGWPSERAERPAAPGLRSGEGAERPAAPGLRSEATREGGAFGPRSERTGTGATREGGAFGPRSERTGTGATREGGDWGPRSERAGKTGRAGRNLPAAIGVGVVLGGTVLASLLMWKPAFYAVLVVAIGVGTWEMVRAVGAGGARPPLVPLLLGGAVMVGVAWYGGAAALPYGLLGTAVAVLVWRLADGPAGYQRDVEPALLIAVYVPFLASFAALLFRPEDGNFRVLAALAGVVMSDTGGYIAGVFFGRHPMAPSVSPKKSWEGFAGSLLATAVGSAILLYYLLDAAWWHGIVFGLAIAAAATLGDLAESLLKRDLGIKDMSSLLPGHGGLMDRLDSILFAAPTAYAVLTFLVPPT